MELGNDEKKSNAKKAAWERPPPMEDHLFWKKCAGEDRMSTEHNKRRTHPCFEGVGPLGNLAAGDERCAEVEQEALARKIFGLALALATEPSQLGRLRQMLVQLQAQSGLPLDFATWALGHIDARVRSMALEHAHDAEVLLQILSFTGGTFAGLLQAIEDLYQHEQISGRVYVKAKLLLRTAGHQDGAN
jgi:hypothetical protein